MVRLAKPDHEPCRWLNGVAGVNCDNNCHNLLFINQGLNNKGIPTFLEQAKTYGLDDGNYATPLFFLLYALCLFIPPSSFTIPTSIFSDLCFLSADLCLLFSVIWQLSSPQWSS